MIRDILQNIHNRRTVQQLVDRMTDSTLNIADINEQFVKDVYKIQFVTENKRFIAKTSAFLIQHGLGVGMSAYAHGLLEKILINFIRLTQEREYESFSALLEEKLPDIMDYAVKHELELLHYTILNILDKESVYMQLMKT